MTKREPKARESLLNHIGGLSGSVTSGDVTSFVGERTTYGNAWETIREEGLVNRIGVPRGKATTWKRTWAFNKALKEVVE